MQDKTFSSLNSTLVEQDFETRTNGTNHLIRILELLNLAM